MMANIYIYIVAMKWNLFLHPNLTWNDFCANFLLFLCYCSYYSNKQMNYKWIGKQAYAPFSLIFVFLVLSYKQQWKEEEVVVCSFSLFLPFFGFLGFHYKQSQSKEEVVACSSCPSSLPLFCFFHGLLQSTTNMGRSYSA